MNTVATVRAGQSLWVKLNTVTARNRINLTRSVDRIVVKTQLPECQLHGTMQAWWRWLVYEIIHLSYSEVKPWRFFSPI